MVRNINVPLDDEKYLKLAQTKTTLQLLCGKKMSWEDYLDWSMDMVVLLVQKPLQDALDEAIRNMNLDAVLKKQVKKEAERFVKGFLWTHERK